MLTGGLQRELWEGAVGAAPVVPRPGRRALTAIGVLLTAIVIALETLPDTRSNEAVAIAAFDTLLNASFVWAGVLGAILRPRTPLGPVMMAVGVAGALGNLVFAETVPVAYTVGLLSIGLFTAPLTHVLLSYPDGRLRGRVDRVLVLATYVHLTVQWWSFATFADPRADGCGRCAPGTNLVGFFEDAGTYRVLVTVQVVVSVVLAVLVLWRLGERWRRASPVGRTLLAPVLSGGLVCATATLTTAPLAYQTLGASSGAVVVHAIWALAFGAIPVGYSLGLVRDAVRRTRLAVLLAELATSTEAGPLRNSVRRALGDPTADVLLVAADGVLRDLDGHVRPRNGRALWRTEEGAMIAHDPVLRQDGELVCGVGRAVGLALGNRRLELEVRQRLAEAKAAQLRVVEAGDEARRRIERDLHDGLQQTLVSLRLSLRVLREDADLSGDAAALLTDACDLAAAATQDLRSLAQGVYPMVLTAAGLPAALHELGDTAPVLVTLDVCLPRRSSPVAEAAAYFCCCEAITNVAKHAGVDRCEVRGTLNGGTLELTIVDDGCGGAGPDAGSGLRGLADRAAAVGGTLRLDSPPGGPTVMGIRIPWPGPDEDQPAAPASPIGADAIAAIPARVMMPVGT